MLSWWTNMESVATLNTVLLVATIVFAVVGGVLMFLSLNKSRQTTNRLANDLTIAHKQIKALSKTAESIRRELLETQQHQDISQLKLKTSKSSSDELRQELLNAKKRLKTAEAAIKAHQAAKAKAKARAKSENKAAKIEADDIDEANLIQTLVDVELEIEDGLSQSQQEQLIDLLDPGPKGNVDIYCIMGDTSSEMAAKQIEEIMTNDGWKTNGVAPSAFKKTPDGLLLAVNSKETAPSYASFLQRVFSTIGLPVTAKIDKKYREWSMSIIVGHLDV